MVARLDVAREFKHIAVTTTSIVVRADQGWLEGVCEAGQESLPVVVERSELKCEVDLRLGVPDVACSR